MKNVIVLFSLIFSANALTTDCFEFNYNEFPDGSLLDREQFQKEIWCYRELSHPDFKTMIFNYDGNKISENLAILIGKEDNFLFYDQLFGKLRVVEQVGLDFNPYQIPLSPPKNTKKLSISFTQAQNQMVEEMVIQMSNAKRKTLDFSSRPGINSINDVISDEESYLPDELLPLDGYWWPYRDYPMAKSEFSPTAVYDLYVKSVTGVNPKSQEWEAKNHALDNIYWGGHCNGWVASTILHGFFDQSLKLKTPGNTVVITPLQIQGMRVETSFCVKFAFYGKRYRTPGDDPRDISPVTFHKTIRYYLKELGKPLALDRIPNEVVDNSIYSGYKLTVEKLSPNNYKVSAVLKTHYYNYSPVNSKRVSTSKNLNYYYTLTTDNEGNIIGGSWDWLSTNPDFLWAPIAQMNCGRENPNMDPKFIDKMIETLPRN